MNLKNFNIIFSVFTNILICDAYRILCVFPYNAKSHNIIFDSLMKGLAKKGHQLDVITHFPMNNSMKNYNVIINLNGTAGPSVNNVPIEAATKKVNMIQDIVLNHGNEFCHNLGLEKFQELIKNPPSNPPYDLVITEAFASHCFMGLGYIFKVPVVAVVSATEYPWISHYVGNMDNLAAVPNVFQNTFGKMNFLERLSNVITYYSGVFKYHSLSGEYQTDLMRKYLGPQIPDIREVEKNVALTLVNNDPILFGAKPMSPALIQIAGLHIEAIDQTLPTDLQKWMDESQDGVVYFSFGSRVIIETLPTTLVKDLYASFKKISPIRVLIRITDSSKLPPGLPSNVKVLPWIPQIPTLAHKNTKVFITHGGLGGVQEGLYFGVPMIGVPLFADQFRNVEALIAKNMLIRIDMNELSETSLDKALSTLIYDPTYKRNATYYSKLFKDQPMSPMNRAIFWIEYVVRNGPHCLRSQALDYTWWQLTLIDVYGFMLFVVIVILTVLLFSIKLLLKVLMTVSRNRRVSLTIYEVFIKKISVKLQKKSKKVLLKKIN